MVVIPFEKHRFRTAAQHYLRGRPAYASALFDRVAQLTALGRDARVLDLGCGPGQLALAFAPRVGEIVGIDPEPEMLRIASESAAAAGVAIRLFEGSSADLGPALGRFHLVVIGRAFHWMDRARTLEALDELIEPGGAVALFHTREPDLPGNPWLKAYHELMDRYSVDDEARRRRRSPEWVPHEAILLESPFNRIETIGVLEQRRTPVEQFVDRALSRSGTSAGKIGGRTANLSADLRTMFAPFAVDGMVGEVIHSTAMIAWRRGER
jgi:SAM-dependent methyltransferase